MINSVEKIYRPDNSGKFCFKVIDTNNKIIFVPNNKTNRHYQAIQEWIAAGNTVIDNGGNS
jgi:uncharacterized pyridoxamine 5'-phosphate oxidase family protein